MTQWSLFRPPSLGEDREDGEGGKQKPVSDVPFLPVVYCCLLKEEPDVAAEEEGTIAVVGQGLADGCETSALPVPAVPKTPGGLNANTQDLMELIRVGKVVVASGDFPLIQSAAAVAVRILVGREKGLSPFDSLAAVYLVNGRATFSANAMAGFVKRSGRYDYRIKKHTNEGCEIAFYEGTEELGVSSFSMQDAKAANLNGNNWRFYPRNMLFARAMSNGVKWFCPDLLACGAYVHGELGDDDVIEADFTTEG
jgi:hypothetical protein